MIVVATFTVAAYLAAGLTVAGLLDLTGIQCHKPTTVAFWPLAVITFVGAFLYGFIKGDRE